MDAVKVRFGTPYDLRRSLGLLGQGGYDPSTRWAGGRFEQAARTPEGTVLWTVTADAPDAVTVAARGEGAGWVLARADRMTGAGDDPSTLIPQHGIVRTLHARFAGLRFLTTGLVFERLLPAIIEQKVIVADAVQAYRRLVRRYGEKFPDSELMVPPAPPVLAELAYPDYHSCGLERKRAETIRYAAKRARRLEECVDMPLADAHERLKSLPGIGPWTAAKVAMAALGDADAVLVGDFHLPNTVAYALAGEHRGDDARMLELLEPYRGHRGRVIRYLTLGGIAAPRRGPRLARIDIAKL